MSNDEPRFALDRTTTRHNPRALSIDERARAVSRILPLIEITEECWIWKGRLGPGGYGQVGFGALAHRVLYELLAACRPLESTEWLLHSCDTRLCVRPSHLRIGTPADNVNDMHSRGRGMRGCPGAGKFTVDEVREIRRLRASGSSQQQIADRFGVTRIAISAIDTGKSYGWLERIPGEERPTQRVRSRRGPELPWSKLTEDAVRDIRRRRAAGAMVKDLAEQYGVTREAISAVANGKTYRWVT